MASSSPSERSSVPSAARPRRLSLPCSADTRSGVYRELHSTELTQSFSNGVTPPNVFHGCSQIEITHRDVGADTVVSEQHLTTIHPERPSRTLFGHLPSLYVTTGSHVHRQLRKQRIPLTRASVSRQERAPTAHRHYPLYQHSAIQDCCPCAKAIICLPTPRNSIGNTLFYFACATAASSVSSPPPRFQNPTPYRTTKISLQVVP